MEPLAGLVALGLVAEWRDWSDAGSAGCEASVRVAAPGVIKGDKTWEGRAPFDPPPGISWGDKG